MGQQSKTSMMRVSMHLSSDGTRVSMLVAISRNKCFFQVRMTMFHVLYPSVIYLLILPRIYSISTHVHPELY
jgi:hypothetical protein